MLSVMLTKSRRIGKLKRPDLIESRLSLKKTPTPLKNRLVRMLKTSMNTSYWRMLSFNLSLKPNDKWMKSKSSLMLLKDKESKKPTIRRSRRTKPLTTTLRHWRRTKRCKLNGCKKMSTIGNKKCSMLLKTVTIKHSQNSTISDYKLRSNSKLLRVNSKLLMPNSLSRKLRRMKEIWMKKWNDSLMSSTQDRRKESKHSTLSKLHWMTLRATTKVPRMKSINLKTRPTGLKLRIHSCKMLSKHFQDWKPLMRLSKVKSDHSCSPRVRTDTMSHQDSNTLPTLSGKRHF